MAFSADHVERMDSIDAVVADLPDQHTYGVPSYRLLLDYATQDFDREGQGQTGVRGYGTFEPMCPTCVDELEEHGIEAMLDSWHRKDPYCTVVTDEEEVPARFRPDKASKHEEYIAVLCPDHPEVFLGYMHEEYDDADAPLR